MKTGLITIAMLTLISNTSRSQQWQTIFMADSRIGYSTNTYLNPFFSEWDSSVESGYGLTSLIGRSFWHKGATSVSVTGGLVYEPFLDETDAWKGGFGLTDITIPLPGNFTANVNGGGSFFSSSFNRTQAWIQPGITWSVSPFSQIRVKAGSSFRKFDNFTDTLDTGERFDLFALEFETWPGYQWRITAGLYGNLDTIPSIGEGFTSRITGGYFFKNGASVSLSLGLEQYRFETIAAGGGGGGPGGPPGGGFPAGESVTNTDRLFRAKVEGSYPVGKRLSVFADLEGLQFDSDQSAVSGDFQVSGGIRLSIQARHRAGNKGINPEWEQERNTHVIQVVYQGEGRLYLVGSFNDWNKAGIPLTEQSKNRYVGQIELETGAYEYKILRIRGDSEEWLPFSDEIYTVSDGFGGENAVILVE